MMCTRNRCNCPRYSYMITCVCVCHNACWSPLKKCISMCLCPLWVCPICLPPPTHPLTSLMASFGCENLVLALMICCSGTLTICHWFVDITMAINPGHATLITMVSHQLPSDDAHLGRWDPNNFAGDQSPEERALLWESLGYPTSTAAELLL